MNNLNNNMNHSTATTIVMNALKKAAKADFKPFHWTFVSKDGSETVQFIASKSVTEYLYTRTKSFLGFKYGKESFVLTSNDNEMDTVLWHQLGDVLNNTTARFGVN